MKPPARALELFLALADLWSAPTFQWGNRQPMEMVCLVGTDLDNYARLTCHWGMAGNPHAQPGMEAYFAQEPWDPVK